MHTRIGLIGLGYWGPNLVRCFNEVSQSEVVMVCDRDSSRLSAIGGKYPHIRTTVDAAELLESDEVDAVVIATPTTTHYDLAMRALAANKHVFVEKPLATTSHECEQMIKHADDCGRTLFVGHIFLHSGPVTKLYQLVTSGELGTLRYISSNRLNLGPVRQDVNALWDLAPHDVSIMLYLLKDLPNSVSCNGQAYLTKGVHDVCNLTMHFPSNRMGIVNVSWLDPHKKRTMTVVGSKKMVCYDDLEMEKIKIYDKGVEAPAYSSNFSEFQFSYRYGDTFSPRIEQVEPMLAECSDFIHCIRTGRQPLTNGVNGLNVVKVLEAAEKSLLENGQKVYLDEVPEEKHEFVAK